jgi:hypothetical protein
VIDDNPEICKSLVAIDRINFCEEHSKQKKYDHITPSEEKEIRQCSKCLIKKITVIAPYYPAMENQHHKEVVLVKNEVSDLKKEDFNK